VLRGGHLQSTQNNEDCTIPPLSENSGFGIPENIYKWRSHFELSSTVCGRDNNEGGIPGGRGQSSEV
jgi:hypothetical protein